MVQKFVFDPQTLIDEEKKEEKNKVKKVLSEQEEFDKTVEKENEKAKKLEEAEKLEDAEKRKGIVSEVFEGVKDALKEVNYAKKYGGEKYLKAKKEEDPDHPMFDTPTEKLKAIKESFSDFNSAIQTEISGEAQAYTLAESQGDKEKKRRSRR